MAALIHQRTEATYEVHESIKVDTQDNEDHTFCGIMFPVKCKNILPLNHIVIRSVAVRGQLGPLTVWVNNVPTNGNSNNSNSNNNNNSTTTTSFRLSKQHWTKIYDKVHGPSIHSYVSLELDPPIIMKAGDVRAIYVHSTLPGDEAIVYDNAYYYLPRRAGGPGGDYGNNSRNKPRYDDAMISVYTGRAHVSNTPFGQMPIWGWGNAWRDHREFVGQLEYGAVYQLWNPIKETRYRFGPNFTKAVYAIFMGQRRWESPLSLLPDECLFYILHMCRWDWFNDSKDIMKRQQQQRRLKQQQRSQQQDTATNNTTDQQQTNPQQQDNNVNNDQDDEDDTDYVYEEDEGGQDEYDDGYYDDDYDAYMDSDEAEEENEEEEVDENDDDDDDEDWEEGDGGVYVPDHQVFRFLDDASDEEENEEQGLLRESSRARHAWIRRQFVRINILRALAQQEDNDNDDDMEQQNDDDANNNNNIIEDMFEIN